MPGLRATLIESANLCSGRSLVATAPSAAHIASSTGSTRAAALLMSSTLTTAQTFTTAPKGDFHHRLTPNAGSKHRPTAWLRACGTKTHFRACISDDQNPENWKSSRQRGRQAQPHDSRAPRAS